MKPEELRVGNWVQYKQGFKKGEGYCQVELIHDKHFDCRHKLLGFTPNGEYKPIPLTPEILEKCGFDNVGLVAYSIKISDYSMLVGNKTGFELVSRVNDKINVVPVLEMPHLHQLQNLYYALTGEELTIEL